jgi:probable rRNA maturation factor
MLLVDIISNKFVFDKKRVKQILELMVKEDAEISLSVVEEAKMKQLHKKYMETAEVTDVLSFPTEDNNFFDGIRHLGDIVICHPVAVKQARENGRPVQEEIEFLAEHGMKHLLGIHHDE